jgi:integrase
MRGDWKLLRNRLQVGGGGGNLSRTAVAVSGAIRPSTGISSALNVAAGTSGEGEMAIEMPSRDELRTILNAAAGRWRPLIITALFTGLRGSELRGLTWPDVDLRIGVLQVRRRADQWGRFGPPKSKAGKRDIAMTPMVLNALREWKLACPHTRDDLVFPAIRARPGARLHPQGCLPLATKGHWNCNEIG